MQKGFAAAAVAVLTAVLSTSAFAGWGCAVSSRDHPIAVRRWAADSEKQARDYAMQGCAKLKLKGCRVVGCSDNVDSKEDADKLWATTPGVTYVPCGEEGQKKC